MKNRVIQLYKSGHPTHDIVIDLVAEELNRRRLPYVMSVERNFRKDRSIYFTYLLITGIKSTQKLEHPLIYGMHGLGLMKDIVSVTYKELFDCSLVPTEKWLPYYAEKVSADYCVKVVNGVAKFDLFVPKVINKKAVCQRYGFDLKKPVVLYAPTYGMSPSSSLNGSEYLRDAVMAQCKNVGMNVLYVAHPGSEHMQLLDIANKSELYSVCDILVSDTSGVTSEFLCYNKPIIRVKKDLHYYRENDFNLWGGDKLVDFGDICSVENLGSALLKNYSHDWYKEERKYWLANYFGKIDGKCTQREVDCMLAFAKEWWQRTK